LPDNLKERFTFDNLALIQRYLESKFYILVHFRSQGIAKEVGLKRVDSR
jgi:hypothetical protein